MPRLKASNNAGSTLAENISDVATSFDVVDAAAFPNPPFRATIFTTDPANGEIIEVGAVSTNTFSSVQRGLEDTIAQSWDLGTKVQVLITVGYAEELVFKLYWGSTEPSTKIEYETFWFDTNVNAMKVWDGSDWQYITPRLDPTTGYAVYGD